jgi:hypothetical protein
MSDASFDTKWMVDEEAIGSPFSNRHSNIGHAPQVRMVDVATEAMEAAWEEASGHLGGAPLDPLPLWTKLATRILTAVSEGERDPQRLKQIALAPYKAPTLDGAPGPTLYRGSLDAGTGEVPASQARPRRGWG